LTKRSRTNEVHQGTHQEGEAVLSMLDIELEMIFICFSAKILNLWRFPNALQDFESVKISWIISSQLYNHSLTLIERELNGG
jgi:hypothetical protein